MTLGCTLSCWDWVWLVEVLHAFPYGETLLGHLEKIGKQHDTDTMEKPKEHRCSGLRGGLPWFEVTRDHQGSPGITTGWVAGTIAKCFTTSVRACCAYRACPSASSPVSSFPQDFFVFSVHVDPKQITKQKGQYKQKMTNVTELSSKHQSLGREFGCVLALDGLRSDIQRRHWLGPLNLSWQAKRPRACEPTCTRPKVSPAKHVLKNSIIRFERQVLSFTLGSQKSKINEPCYSKKSL